MKNLKGKFKKIVSVSSIASLLQTPIVFAAGDQNSQNNPTKRATEVMSTVTNGLQMYSQFLQVNNQQRLQQIQNQQLQKQMASLAPTVVDSKIFPECAITPSMSNSVKDFCYAEASVNAVNSNNQMKQLADSWVNTLDKILNTASNGQTEIGILCLQNRQKSLDDNFQELLNNLTRLEQQLDTEKESFKKLNAAILDQMKTIKSELSGGTEGTNLDTKTKDYTSLFSKDCQTIIANETAKLSSSGGLLGISSAMSPAKKLANDHNQSKLAVENEIRRDVQKAVEQVKKYGIGGLSTNFGFTTQYKALSTQLNSEQGQFLTNYQRIQKELAKLEYDVPELDKNFTVDLNEFTTQAKDYFKKRYINQCVTGADKTGTALTTDQVLSALRQKSTNNKGTAAAQFKVALENIINSDAFIQDKVNQIKALENTYKDISVTYRSSTGQSVTSSPYDLYIKQINLCEQQYASSNAASSSEKKKVERGVSLLNELQTLNNNFASTLTTNALDALLNCSGNSAKNGLSGNACNSKELFDFTSENYCLSIANSCANTITGCDAELTNQITIRKNKQKALAATYNTNMQNMITKANALVKAQNTAIIAMMKKIQAKFPGTNIAIPEDILIKTPDLLSTKYDVALLGDGNLTVMDDVNSKIKILKASIEDQRGSTADAIATYINEQKNAASTERAKWLSVYQDCAQKEQESTGMIAQMNQEGQQRQSEEDAKVGAFCRKYGSLKNNPMAACGGSLEKLSTDLDAVYASGRIKSEVEYNIGELTNLCAQYNNESEAKFESAEEDYQDCLTQQRANPQFDCSSKLQAKRRAERNNKNKSADNSEKLISIEKICGNKNNPTKDKELISKLAKYAPKSEQSALAKIEKLEDFVEKVDETEEFSNISKFFEILDDEGLSSSDANYCANLYQKLYSNRDIAAVDSNKSAASTTVSTAKTDNGETAAKPAATAAETSTAAPATAVAKTEVVKDESFNSKIKSSLESLTNYADFETRKTLAFNRFGEQATNDCDSQLSTTASTNKGMDFLKAFDAGVLGSSKAK